MQPYIVIEDFYTKEQCQPLIDWFLANEDWDPREFYGNVGLGGKDEFFGENPKRFDFDKEGLLQKAVHFAYNKFLESYDMDGEFGLNRAHANYMHAGALLHSHHDDRNYREEPIEDLNSKTYVAGLFLTDDYDGGELTFEESGVSLKPKVGDLVLFPGFYSMHGVNEVTRGTRLNILIHFFDVKDPSIPYNPNYAVDPTRPEGV